MRDRLEAESVLKDDSVYTCIALNAGKIVERARRWEEATER